MNLKLIVTTAAVVATLAAPAFADEVLKLGNEGNYPPFSITNADGSLTGLEPDLARAMCARMEAKCEIQAMDFTALLPSLAKGKLDAIATQVFPTDERKKVAAFTDPILENPLAFAVSKDWENEATPEALDGKTVGSIKSNWANDILKKYAPGATLQKYDNLTQIMLDLKSGRIDAGLAGRLNWIPSLIDQEGGADWKLVATSGEMAGRVEAYSWTVALGNDELLKRMNTALESLFADCSYTKIRVKYFSQPTSPREPTSCL